MENKRIRIDAEIIEGNVNFKVLHKGKPNKLEILGILEMAKEEVLRTYEQR